MRVALITPWNKQCGLATYSQALAAELEKRCELSVVAWDAKRRLSTLFAPVRRFGEILSRMRRSDVVHVQYEVGSYLFFALPVFRIASWLTRTPLVVTHHERPRSKKAPVLVRFYERVFSSPGDLTIVHTREHASEIAGNVRVIPHGVETQGEYESDDETLLVAGFWVRWKRYDRAIRAFAEALERAPAQLRIIGTVHHKKHYEECMELIEALGIEERVTIETSYVSKEEFSRAFATAALVVIPYEEMTASGILAHAIGHATPIVSHELATVAEYAGRGAALVNMDDPHAAGTLIAELLADRKKRMQMHEALLERRAALSWEIVAEQTIDAYEAIQKRPAKHENRG